MRSLSRSARVLALAGVFAVLGALPAAAAETANSEFVIIQPDDVVADDLYAGAIKVLVEGVIDGDLIAFAGEEVVIDGVVTGSVFVVAPRVIVNGSVEGSLRVASGSLRVSGSVGGDIVVSAMEVQLGGASSVERDVQAWVVDMTALGHIGRNLKGSQRTLALAGTVDGDVDVSVARLTVVDDLEVRGDLGYRSSDVAEGLDNADVGGALVHKTPLPPNIRVRALGLFGRFLAVLFLTIAALGVAYGWPERTTRAVERVGSSPGRSWLSGALVMLSPLLLAGAAALVVTLAPASASFPLLAIMVPVLLAALGLVLALSFVAGIPAVGRLGRALFKGLDLNGAVLAGSIIVGLVWLLPLLGWLVPLIVLPLGLGAWMHDWLGDREMDAE